MKSSDRAPNKQNVHKEYVPVGGEEFVPERKEPRTAPVSRQKTASVPPLPQTLSSLDYVETRGWVIPEGSRSWAEGPAEKALFLRSAWRVGGVEG